MQIVTSNGTALHWREDGTPEGAPVVFANSLGTDLHLWDEVVARMPEGLRLIRWDLRGHGQSGCPDGPYRMDELISDAEALIEAVCDGPVIFVGLSIGGMIGQGLAARRPDLIRALVLSNTAAKLGTAEMWNARMGAIRSGGMAAQGEAILARWFAPDFIGQAAQPWRAMLERTPVEGYLGCCAAIAGADLTEGTRRLELPTLVIAGEQDGASPPDLVRATADLIAGSAFHVIPRVGHLPCVEAPDAYTALLAPFVKEHAHD